MADLQQKHDLDLRFGGSTLGDFGYFYDNELPYIYACLNAIRRNDVSPAGDNVEPAPKQFKVEDNKIYIRDTENQSWVFLMDVAYKGGFLNEGESFIKNIHVAADGATAEGRAGKVARYGENGKLPDALYLSDKATENSKANKLAVYNEDGVLPANITGSAGMLAGKRVDAGGIQDGQVMAYSQASNTWIPVDRMSSVGQGRSLSLRDYKGYLGTYNGGATTEVELPVAKLMPESTYSKGEIAFSTQIPAGMALVCVHGGNTPSVIPSLAGD